MPIEVKTKKAARDYMPWAGFFADPSLESEAFSTLPGWRQRQTLFIRERAKTGLGYTLEEYLAAGHSEVTENVPLTLPADLTFTSLTLRTMGDPPVSNMVKELESATSDAVLMEQCTISGEGRRLLNERPEHGLYAYVWARVLVHKKILLALPLPYLWELEEGLHALTGKVLNVRSDKANVLLAWLDRRAIDLAARVA